MVSLEVLEERRRESLLILCHTRTQWEGNHRKAKKRALARSWIGGHPGLGLPTSRTMRNTYLMLKPLCLRPFVTAEAADYCTLQIAVRCFHVCIAFIQGFPIRARGKELACQCRRHKRCRFHLWFGKIPWRRAGQPTPVFLPGESHGQRSLAGYSPWGHKKSDMTEWLTHTHNVYNFIYLSHMCRNSSI